MTNVLALRGAPPASALTQPALAVGGDKGLDLYLATSGGHGQLAMLYVAPGTAGSNIDFGRFGSGFLAPAALPGAQDQITSMTVTMDGNVTLRNAGGLEYAALLLPQK